MIGREGQRVERIGDTVDRVGVHGEIGALLDDRTGERVIEIAHRQDDLGGLAPAFLTGLVLGDQRDAHLGTGPGMRGEVPDRLAGAVAGAELRQRQRDLRRIDQRSRRRPARRRVDGCDLGIAGDDAIVVAKRVGQAERAGRGRPGRLGESYPRRIVGLDGKAPGRHLALALADRDRARPLEREIALERLVASRCRGFGGIGDLCGLRLGGADDADHVEIVGAAGAHGDDAAGGDRILGAGRLRRLAGEEDGRPAGIGGRRHPGIDPRNRRARGLAAAEGLGQPFEVLRAGIDEGDHEEERDQEPEGARIAPGKIGGGDAGLEPAEGGEQAGAVRCPERPGGRVFLAGDQAIGKSRRRAMQRTGGLLDPAERGGPAGASYSGGLEEEVKRGHEKSGDHGETGVFGNVAPETKPGDGRKQGGKHHEGCEARPYFLPKEDEAGSADGALDARPRLRLGGRAVAVDRRDVRRRNHPSRTTFHLPEGKSNS